MNVNFIFSHSLFLIRINAQLMPYLFELLKYIDIFSLFLLFYLQ